MTAVAPIISVKKLSVWYGEKRALNGIDLDVSEKKVTTLIGPSGCGKSTLLNLLGALDQLDRDVEMRA